VARLDINGHEFPSKRKINGHKSHRQTLAAKLTGRPHTTVLKPDPTPSQSEHSATHAPHLVPRPEHHLPDRNPARRPTAPIAAASTGGYLYASTPDLPPPTSRPPPESPSSPDSPIAGPVLIAHPFQVINESEFRTFPYYPSNFLPLHKNDPSSETHKTTKTSSNLQARVRVPCTLPSLLPAILNQRTWPRTRMSRQFRHGDGHALGARPLGATVCSCCTAMPFAPESNGSCCGALLASCADSARARFRLRKFAHGIVLFWT
jgi:hypothetical protein